MQPQQVSKDDKQVFLRNQILEGGLDPESFMDFMGTIKNQAENIDLENWTIDQLKKLVQDFKEQIKADQATLEQVNQSRIRQSHQVMSKILKSSMFKKQKINYDKSIYDYELTNEQECKKIPLQFNFNPKIKPVAHIKNWQVRSQGGFLGFGATKQLWLKIETNFTQNAIQRTNSDLEWFRNALLKFHPGSYVPPLADLRSIEPQDKKGLAQRAKLIEFFLNSVIQYDYLIQSQISKIFLTQMDHNKLANYKTKQRSIAHSKNVGRIENLEGKFHLELSNRTQKFIKNSGLFGKVAQQLYTDIDTHINKVLSDMETLSKHVLYVSNSCGALHQKYTKICGLNEISSNGMENIMVLLYNMLSNIGKNIKDHMAVIKEFSDEYVHSSIRSWEEFLLHDKRYQKEFEAYVNFKSELTRKKQRYFNDVSKWQLQTPQEYEKTARMNIAAMQKEEVFGMMFPRDNKMEEQLRIWIAYLNKAYEGSFRTLLAAEQTHIRQRLNIYVEKTNSLNNETYFSKELKKLIAVSA